MKYVHILPRNEELRFTASLINFINETFGSEDQLFLYLGASVENTKEKQANVFVIRYDFKSFLILISSMCRADQIYIHGLFSHIFTFVLFLQPWLIKKCRWIILSGDLYEYRENNRTIKDKLREFFKKPIIKNCHTIFAYYKGDYDLAVQWYHTKAKYGWINYPMNNLENLSIQPEFPRRHDNPHIIIQVGHKADPAMNHAEIFERLKKYDSQNIIIFCPLSTGDNKYAKIVEKKGREMFGENFLALMEVLPIKDYLEHLMKVDIAIFGNRVHLGGANMNVLLYYGKKVYLCERTTQWQYFIENKVKVFSIESDFDNLLTTISDKAAMNNYKIVKKINSKETMISSFQEAFTS